MGSVAFSSGSCTDPQCVEHVRQLIGALEHRDVIGMAKGVLMARSKLTPDEAFAMLCSASQRENVKLWEVAARIVSEHAPPVAPH
ncbi:MAG: two-component system response regulator [Ilumatobacteraceae bacterium]|nr:two-component system response regulator [Ilumatobacteraceae bacterium]